MANFQDYINVIKTGMVKPRIKIEWLRKDETVESVIVEDVLDGSLTINRNNGVRRTMTFTIQNSPSLIPNIFGVWIDKRLRLSLGVVCDDGEDYFIPQGVFILSDPSYVSMPNGSTVTLNCNDKFTKLNGEDGGILLDVYQINSGTPVTSSIQTLLTTFEDVIPPIIQPNNQTFPYQIIKQQGDNVGDLLKEIANFMSYNCYYDELGRMIFAEDMSDDIKSSLWDFNSEDDKFSYLGSTLNYEFSACRNTVRVIGNNILGVPVQALAQDVDLSSDTNIYVIGVRPAEPVINSILQTQGQCQLLADYMLKRLKAVNQSVSISSIPMYHLDVDSVITITDELHNLNKNRFLITNINIPLGLFGEMKITAVKTDEVDFTIGEY